MVGGVGAIVATDVDGSMDEIDVDKRENLKGEGNVRKEKFGGKVLQGKRKRFEKRKKKQVGGENVNNIGKKASDELIQSSDDDFVDKFGAKQGLGKSNKKLGRRKKMDDGNVKRGRVPVVETKGGRISLRNAPCSLFRVITSLTAKQKQDVIDMGFGDLLHFKIKDVPKTLAYWLVDMFDADTCSLNVNNMTIKITPELVRKLLGVPMGEVHIDSRDVSDFRNPLICKWKEQFGSIKRHYVSHVEKEIIGKGQSGWMFKLNFLVLFFTIVGESNLGNTVNLKFMHCINGEDDIQKLDWCTYIIDCLVKTKGSWKRDGFYNGPLVLLLVLYGHFQTPIKICSSDMLGKLEAELFGHTDDSDTVVCKEADFDVNDEEQVPEENNMDYYGVGVPEDVEGKKKYVSKWLKKAGELVEMVDEVVDGYLQNNPTSSDFLELKELRNQLFTEPRYSQQHRNQPDENEEDWPNHQDENEEDDRNNANVHTPNNQGFPWTQAFGSPTGIGELKDKVWEEWHMKKSEHIPTRLNFDELDDIDLNVTQPPATQGKVVGGAYDESNIVEDYVVTQFMVNYVSPQRSDDEFFTPEQTIGVCENSNTLTLDEILCENESKAIVPALSQPVPLDVLQGNIPYGRTSRRVLLPEILRSPYVVREVSLISPISPHESRAAKCLFSARLTETDTVFRIRDVDGPRSVLETLYPGLYIASGAIDMFTHVLNEAEKMKNSYTVNRLFCHTAMVTSAMKGWEYHTAREKFNENMNDVLQNSLYKTLVGVELVFFPLLIGNHFILMCMNLKDCVVQLFDNIASNVTSVRETYGLLPLVMAIMFFDYMAHVNHPKHVEMRKADWMMMTVGCCTKENYVDCGVFVMRHMETFKGDVDSCGFSKEGEEQIRELKELRHKYVAKILLADCNEVKEVFEREAHEYKMLPLKHRYQLDNDALKKIMTRAKQMMR